MSYIYDILTTTLTNFNLKREGICGFYTIQQTACLFSPKYPCRQS